MRPGSIRQARKEAGLSLGQVASGQISRTAIFLAETGKTRPTLPTVQLIASRTGKPVDYFLEHDAITGQTNRPDIDRLRDLAVREKFDELLAAVEEARTVALDPLDRAFVSYYAALGELHRANAYGAFPELMKARAAFDAAGDQWMVVECMDLEGVGLHLLEDRAALQVTEAALAACRKLSPANRALEAKILGHLGSIHVANHRWSKAVDCYTMAVEVAGQMKDLSRVGKMYNDLGIVYEHLGDLTRSRSYAQKAVTIHELLNDRIAVARAENNLGLVLMRQHRLDQAREHLNRSLSICDEVGVEVGKTHVLLSLAELDMSDNDPDGARRRLLEAKSIAERNHEPGSIALAHEQLGQVGESIGDRAEADREYAAAIKILQASDLADRLVSCLAAYAQILERRGDTAGALDHLKRAMAAARPDLSGQGAKSSAKSESASA